MMVHFPLKVLRRAVLTYCRLNKGIVNKRFVSTRVPSDECTNPTLGYMSRRDVREPRGIVRRQDAVVPGYTTKDDWGADGPFAILEFYSRR